VTDPVLSLEALAAAAGTVPAGRKILVHCAGVGEVRTGGGETRRVD